MREWAEKNIYSYPSHRKIVENTEKPVYTGFFQKQPAHRRNEYKLLGRIGWRQRAAVQHTTYERAASLIGQVQKALLILIKQIGN